MLQIGTRESLVTVLEAKCLRLPSSGCKFLNFLTGSCCATPYTQSTNLEEKSHLARMVLEPYYSRQRHETRSKRIAIYEAAASLSSFKLDMDGMG